MRVTLITKASLFARPSALQLAAILSAAVALLLITAVAGGQYPPANRVCQGGVCRIEPASHPAVARIVNATDNTINHGSGTLIAAAADDDGKAGFVLTCAHLFREAVGEVTVSFPDGGSYRAKLLGVDRQWDLAVLRIARPQAAAIAIAADAPRPGQWLKSCGYGRDGRYWCNRGQVRGYVRTEGTQSCETLEISGTARQGDSGGPIFNERGELVAVLWGTNGQIVGGTYCGRIRLFLQRLFGGPANNATQGDAAGRPVVPVRRDAENHALLQRLREKLEKIESNVALSEGLNRRIAQRLENVETRSQDSGIKEKARQIARDTAKAVAKDIARQVAEELLAEQNSPAVAAWVPGLMAGLGWTGPPAVAATLAIMLAGRLLRRRVEKRLGVSKHGDPETRRGEEVGRSKEIEETENKDRQQDQAKLSPLNDTYASQLADVFALSGHSPTADATLGREYDEELSRAASSSDGALAAWARDLRDRVAKRFYRIHGQQPMPAEPLKTNQ